GQAREQPVTERDAHQVGARLDLVDHAGDGLVGEALARLAELALTELAVDRALDSEEARRGVDAALGLELADLLVRLAEELADLLVDERRADPALGELQHLLRLQLAFAADLAERQENALDLLRAGPERLEVGAHLDHLVRLARGELEGEELAPLLGGALDVQAVLRR